MQRQRTQPNTAEQNCTQHEASRAWSEWGGHAVTLGAWRRADTYNNVGIRKVGMTYDRGGHDDDGNVCIRDKICKNLLLVMSIYAIDLSK